MVNIIADNIISALGFSSEENYRNLKNGISGLKTSQNMFGMEGNFCTSQTDDTKLNELFYGETLQNPHKYTKFEKLSTLSAFYAIKEADIDASSPQTAFILSTTKGNIQLLEHPNYDQQRVQLWHTAKLVAGFFGNNNYSVVSNACISGVCAIITAVRAIEQGRLENIVVTGADVLSKFTISGFMSFKALSPLPCRPFDQDRCGLNIGEAAATVVMSKYKKNDKKISFLKGSIRNDANHISGPSRTGEGSYNALTDIISNANINDIAFINCHGTSTPYNDEMEAIAIDRAMLNKIPINSLKGYYGHTLGAAGILETIISSYEINDGLILKTEGFQTLGVSRNVCPTTKNTNTDKNCFIKLISGFGGTNAAAIFKKGE